MMRYFFWAILFISIGCTSEVSLNQEDYAPQMVVDGWIEPGEPAMVYLTLSSPYLTQYDSVSIIKSFLNHAKVTISSSTGEEEVLTLFKKNDFFPPYVYKSTQLTGVVGCTYRLKVEYQSKVLTASTTIPSPPLIQSISFLKNSENRGSLIVSYIPKDTVLSYFLFQTAQKSFKLQLYPTFYPLQSAKIGTNKIIAFELFKGRTNNINDLDNHPSYIDSICGPRYYWIKDTVWVAVSSLDSQSFKVLNSIFFNLANYDNPFNVSNKAITNIKGGLGRWTGLGTSKVFFNISSKDSTYIIDE